MTIEVKSSHKTPVGGNVFVDLGFEPQQDLFPSPFNRRFARAAKSEYR
jgi:hypothetical protein